MKSILLLALLFASGGLMSQDSLSISNKISLREKSTKTKTTTKPVHLSRGMFIGIEAGGNLNYLLTDISGLSFTKYNPRAGYSFGVPLEFRLNHWLSIFSDPGYIKKNYQVARTGFFQGVNETHINSYLQVPMILRLYAGEGRLKGFLSVGGYVGYWVSGRVKGTEPNILNPVDTAYQTSNPTSIFGLNKAYGFNEKYDFNNTRDNRLELGWLLGLGASFELNATYRFFMECRATNALSDQQKHYMINQVPRYDETYSLLIGCMINTQHLIVHRK